MAQFFNQDELLKILDVMEPVYKKNHASCYKVLAQTAFYSLNDTLEKSIVVKDIFVNLTKDLLPSTIFEKLLDLEDYQFKIFDKKQLKSLIIDFQIQGFDMLTPLEKLASQPYSRYQSKKDSKQFAKKCVVEITDKFPLLKKHSHIQLFKENYSSMQIHQLPLDRPTSQMINYLAKYSCYFKEAHVTLENIKNSSVDMALKDYIQTKQEKEKNAFKPIAVHDEFEDVYQMKFNLATKNLSGLNFIVPRMIQFLHQKYQDKTMEINFSEEKNNAITFNFCSKNNHNLTDIKLFLSNIYFDIEKTLNDYSRQDKMGFYNLEKSTNKFNINDYISTQDILKFYTYLDRCFSYKQLACSLNEKEKTKSHKI